MKPDFPQCINAIDWLPSPGPALARMLEVLREDQACAATLERIIRCDPVLCAQVLRVANCAFYGCRGEINTVARAIVILGTAEIRNICLSLCVLDQFPPVAMSASFDHACFWRHALLTGLIAEDIARRTSWMDQEDAYLLGLLHDLGRLVMAAYLAEEYESATALAASRGIPLYEAERELGLTHTDVGAWLGLRWAFPDRIRVALSKHHDPPGAPESDRDAVLVGMADSLAQWIAPTHASFPRPPASVEVAVLTGSGPEEFFTQLQAYQTLAARVDALWEALNGARRMNP